MSESSERYQIISFVSGKGGVGKTTLTTNTSWLLSDSGNRCLIIDLDFHNQGSTSLFASCNELGSSEALKLLMESGEIREQVELCEVDSNLYFLPATFCKLGDISIEDLILNPELLFERLQTLLDYLAAEYDLDCIVLDCHGGVDNLSIAAAALSDLTLMVTEADTVTFGGTLKLLESYHQFFSEHTHRPRIEFILNRIPPKYNWYDLKCLYDQFLATDMGAYSSTKEILCYIPVEKYLSESFGEYPFQVKLAPFALFSKLQLVLFTVFADSERIKLNDLIRRRFRMQKTRSKILKEVVSIEERSSMDVFSAYNVGFLFVLIAMALGLALLVSSELGADEFTLGKVASGSLFFFLV